MPDDNDYEVGYAKPPRGTRFRKGQKRNARGRPKGALNIDSVLARALQEKIFVSENGRRRRITKKQGAVIQLVNRALAGDRKKQLSCFGNRCVMPRKNCPWHPSLAMTAAV